MAQFFHTDPLAQGIAYPIIGKDDLDLAVADAVFVDSAGFLVRVTTSSKVFGFSVDDIDALTATNETVAKVTPKVAPAMAVLMRYGSDQNATQTDIGAYADFGIVSTNGFVLNLVAGSNGQMFVLGFDPLEDSDDDVIVCEVAEPQRLAFAQA